MNGLKLLSVLIGILPVLTAAAGDAQQQDQKSGVSNQARVVMVSPSETILSAQISAQITAVSVAEGDSFAAGQVLVTFDCRVYQAQLKRAQAELAGTRKTAAASSILKEMKAGSTLSSELANSNVAKAEQDVVVLQSSVDQCQIFAPFDGRVTSRRANVHQSLSTGQPVLEILGTSDLEARLIVPSRWLSWLKPNFQFSIRMDETGKTYPATITRLGARIDPASQTLTVMGRIDEQSPDLLAGMSGTAVFDVQ